MGETLDLLQKHSRKTKTEVLPTEQKDRILASIYILMSNVVGNINVIAN